MPDPALEQALPQWTVREAVRPGLLALRRYWAPFLLIQLGAAALVAAYYLFSDVRSIADAIGVFKDRWGLLFSGIGGFCAGGVVPEIAKALTGRTKHFGRSWAASAIFNGFVYFVIAIQVDLFYRFQAHIFGNGVDAGTVLIKTTVDMLLFAPFLCMPTGVLLFEWRAAGFRIWPTLRKLNRVWFRERVVPAIIPGWGFWIPFLLCLYALPLPIQMPLALLGEAAWSLLFVFIATQEGE